MKRERKRTESGVVFSERVIDSHGKVEYLTGGDLQPTLTSSDRCSSSPDMNPPTHLKKGKKNTPIPSFSLFHILQFPRKQSHPSCWLDGETKLRGDLSPDWSRLFSSDKQQQPVPSVSDAIDRGHDLFSAVYEC